MTRFSSLLDQCSRAGAAAGGVALLALTSVADYLAGPEISFSILYAVPVMIASWCGRLRMGIGFAVIAVVVWMTAEFLGGHRYTLPFAIYWNLFARFAVLWIVAYLVSGLRERLFLEQALARTDPLTGVLNSRAFYAHAEEELQRFRRYGHPFTIAYLDLDNFKVYNDRHGHLAGDQLLHAVAAAMRTSARGTDVLARLGGDEFVILFVESGSRAASEAMRKVHAALRETLRQHDPMVTVSAGMVTFVTPPDSTSAMLRIADETMYAAKRAGGDRIIHVTSAGSAVLASA